jgi:hypothetical protein
VNHGALRARGLPGGRAALFLAGAALAPGCVEEPEPDVLDEHDDAGPAEAGAARDAGKDSGQGMSVPVYGVAIDSGFHPVPPYGVAIPPDRDAGPADAGCPQVGNLPVPVYGVPVDSGTQTDVCKDAGRDAGKDSGPMVVPVYGVPFDAGK